MAEVDSNCTDEDRAPRWATDVSRGAHQCKISNSERMRSRSISQHRIRGGRLCQYSCLNKMASNEWQPILKKRQPKDLRPRGALESEDQSCRKAISFVRLRDTHAPTACGARRFAGRDRSERAAALRESAPTARPRPIFAPHPRHFPLCVCVSTRSRSVSPSLSLFLSLFLRESRFCVVLEREREREAQALRVGGGVG